MAFEYNGKHLLIDAACRNYDALIDPTVGKACLEEMVSAIKMTMVLPPVCVRFPQAATEMSRILDSLEAEGLGASATANELRQNLNDPAAMAAGYSAFVMIAESHISLHTFPESDFLTFDCYSCKDFEHQIAIDVLDQTFQLLEKNVQVIARKFSAQPSRRHPLSLVGTDEKNPDLKTLKRRLRSGG